MSAKKTTLASKISETTNILLASLYSDTSINELLRLLCFLLLYASFGIISDTTISDFCHLVSPKVIGLLIRSFSRLLRPLENTLDLCVQ